jgi:tetratricopeptide (TPR) repeat protein
MQFTRLFGTLSRHATLLLKQLVLLAPLPLLMACSEPTVDEIGAETAEPAHPNTAAVDADYVGSSACADCHETAYQQWQNSHHDLALQVATAESVLANRDVEIDGTRIGTEEDGLRIYPNAEGDGLTPRFTFGVEPLQQYIVDGGNGAWQTHPIVWDSRPQDDGGQRWYNLHGAAYPAGDPMHWQGRANRWNSQCADCHSTGVVKGYDPQNRSYQTTFEVEDVSCEACHGPGSAHVANPGEAPLLALTSQAEQINSCAPCHARRGQIAEGFQPDAAFLDHYSPRLISPGLYHPDGQILDEVYVWGSFLQSRMHRAGVTCSNCHEPHSAELKRQGNETCTFCHQASPPDAFTAAGVATGSSGYDSPEHHLHPLGSAGAECVACHMRAETYMGVDDRRDHSFRIPRPDLSLTLGVPEPCTDCHTDQTADWATAVLAEHFGSEDREHFAIPFAAADSAVPGADAQLAGLVMDTTRPIMVRASALARLGTYNRGYTMDAIRAARKDEPLLRFAAPLAAASLSPDRAWRLLTPLLEDDLRAVRHQTVLALLPTLQMDPVYRQRLAPHLSTWIEEQSLNLDYPETLTNVAGAHAALGNLPEAEAALKEALNLQANWVPGLISLADLYRATGRDLEAGPLLEDALALAPDYPEVAYAYALWLFRQGRLPEGLPHLEQAARLAPGQRQYAYTWAIALNDSGDTTKALTVLSTLLQRWPDDPELLIATVTMLRDQSRFSEALPLLDRLIQLQPGDQELIRFREAMRQAAAAG